MTFYSKLMDYIILAIKYFLGISLAIMTAITVLEVVRRYIFGLSYPWSEELVRYMLVWVTFIGGAAAFRTGGLVILDLIVGRLSERKKLILQFLTNTVVFIFLLFLFRNGVTYMNSPVIANQTSIGLGVPMSIPYAALPLGFGLMILFSLEHYARIISKLREE